MYISLPERGDYTVNFYVLRGKMKPGVSSSFEKCLEMKVTNEGNGSQRTLPSKQDQMNAWCQR